ncbi:MAG: phosphoenolpyruvate--protein phosphotransferase [Phycisphaerales bacterium]|nr:phosphoenolpyruvate--protein phosphotransferase [Phycisphaerales bacterium]
MITKKGINASPGVAIGPALVLDTEEYRIPHRTIDPAQLPAQVRNLDAALDASRQEVSELRLAAARKLGDETAAIFSFHEQFIADPKLRAGVVDLIEQHRFTAAYAFAQVMNQRQKLFRNVADPYLKERVRDLYDIEKRVLRHILGRTREDMTRLTEPVIVVAHDITPSQAISFDRRLILAFAINVGGQTSHMSIIARMLGIPAVVALNDITTDVSGGETIVVDGSNGIVVVSPDKETLNRYREQQREFERFNIQLRALRDEPAVTRDGLPVQLLANIEVPEEVSRAIEAGAEGVGLYRTELLFLSSPRLPTEEQQYEAFRAALRAAQGRPVVIRTIDLGADKLAPGMSAQQDHNPVLGLRSLRYCLIHLDMFKVHLRAILRASVEGDMRIMFPMIATVMELRQAKATLADVMEDLDEEGIAFRRNVPIGMMVETPAAALLAGAFARECAFLSIGTNDLTQYTLAVDRANERVAQLYSAHNPAVVRLIHQVIRNARRYKVSVSLCGEMAGNTLYTQLLLGLGLQRFSMAPGDIPAVKRIVRSTTIERCRQIARKVIEFDADRQVLNYLREELRSIVPEEEA